jgi:Glycosyl hydrolase family 26
MVEGPSWNLGPWRTWLQAKPGRKLSFQVAMMPSGMGVTLDQIAAGQHDAHYRTLANNLATYGMLDIELRIGHEMDGGWFAWGAPAGSGKEASYAAAFRRVVTVMRQAQPTNKWKIVWNPTSDNWPLSNPGYLESIWPGDAYVDQVGVDCYDKSFVNGKVYYPSGSDRLQRQKEVWADISKRLYILRDFAVRHGKTMGFPEWGIITYASTYRYSAYGGGDNPYFIQKMHEFFMDPANKVVMQAYFDVSNSHEGDYRVGPSNTIHPLAAAKYKQLFGPGSH